MERVTRKHRSGERTYTVYTEAEAREAKLEFFPWRECRGGDWALTDDGYVIECTDRQKYRTGTLLAFSVAAQWILPAAKLLWEPRRGLRAFGVSPKSWIDVEAGRSRVRRMAKVWAMQVLSGTVNWESVGKAYRSDELKPEATIRRLIKYDQVRKVMDEELEKLLRDKGLTKSDAIDLWREAMQMAREESDPSAFLRGVNMAWDLLGLTNKKKDLPVPAVDITQVERVLSAHDDRKEVTSGKAEVVPNEGQDEAGTPAEEAGGDSGGKVDNDPAI